ncbi:MAG: hypothetical protein ACREN8_11065 [Candidatus Dormibacteraceae bacterium]
MPEPDVAESGINGFLSGDDRRLDVVLAPNCRQRHPDSHDHHNQADALRIPTIYADAPRCRHLERLPLAIAGGF